MHVTRGDGLFSRTRGDRKFLFLTVFLGLSFFKIFLKILDPSLFWDFFNIFLFLFFLVEEERKGLGKQVV